MCGRHDEQSPQLFVELQCDDAMIGEYFGRLGEQNDGFAAESCVDYKIKSCNGGFGVWNNQAQTKSPRDIAVAGALVSVLRRHQACAKAPWQCLNFLPEPQGQASLRPT